MKKHLSVALATTAVALLAGVWLFQPHSAQANTPVQIAQSEAGVSEVKGIVRPGGATLMDFPDGSAIAELKGGAMVSLTGRTASGDWYQGEAEGVGGGWLASAKIIAMNAEVLPVVAPATGAVSGSTASGNASVAESTTVAENAAQASAPLSTTTTAQPVAIAPAVELTVASTETVSLAAGLSGVVSQPVGASDSATIPVDVAVNLNGGQSAEVGQPAVPAIVRSSGTMLTTTPGAAEGIALNRGAMLDVTSVSDDGLWLEVSTTSAPNLSGWVARGDVIYSGITVGTNVDAVASVSPAGASASVAAVPPTEAAPEAAPDATAGATSEGTTAENSSSAADLDLASAPAMTYGTLTVTSGENRLNVRSAPGTANAIVAKADPGSELALLAQNADGSWLQVQAADGSLGWVAADYVTGDVSAAPIIDAPVTTAAPVSDSVAPAASSSVVSAATSTTSATGLTGTIVFQTSPGGTFYAYNLESGAQWPLTSGWDPAISPDGQTVAFARGGGENGIYLIDIDGSNERLIYGERRDLASPKWSPDGAYIVFGRGDSYITCRQIGRECLPDSVWLDRNPNMDVDAFPLVDEYLQNLARVDVNGNDYRDIATLESAREPDWSSAGIVYASSDGLQLTDDSEDAVNHVVYFEPLQARDQDPDWAGERIVFVTRQSSHYQIFSVNPDGTGKSSLTHPVTTLVDQIPSNTAPAFSPDGSQIIFLSNRSERNEAGEWHIWVMNADGSDQRQLPITTPIEYDFNHMEQVLSWGA